MKTWIEQRTTADPQAVLALAARVEDWPRVLPHYAAVRVFSSHAAGERMVEMRARRDIVNRVGIPLWWVARQRVLHDRVEFVHVRGVTRGMDVAWTSRQSRRGEAVVRIEHDFEPHWPVPDSLVRAIVGEFFVNSVARRTLSRLCELAELEGQRISRAT